MTPDEIRKLRGQCHQNPAQFALHLDITEGTVCRWEEGTAEPSPYYERRLQRIRALLHRIPSPVGSEMP